MDIDVVDPEIRPALRRLPDLGVPEGRAKRALLRLALAVVPFGAEKGVGIRTLQEGRLRIRHYRPGRITRDGALLWIHGGGLITGGPRQDDPLCSGTAAALGVQVFSLRYRLAPEHPFPAALDDLHDGWEWLQAHAARFGVDPRRIVIGGESAGGGLAASLTQRLRDGGGAQPRGQWLFAPMLDDRTAADRSLDAAEHWVWPNRANRFGWTSYLGGRIGEDTVPDYAVPARRGDLAGLPPAYLTWGDIELFAAEDARYAERLRDAGVDVTTHVVPGAPHGFENWARSSRPAQALLRHARGWLATRFDG